MTALLQSTCRTQQFWLPCLLSGPWWRPSHIFILSLDVAADVLDRVGEILKYGETILKVENVKEVKQVLNVLGVIANLNLKKIWDRWLNPFYEYVHASTYDEEIPSDTYATEEEVNPLNDLSLDYEIPKGPSKNHRAANKKHINVVLILLR